MTKEYEVPCDWRHGSGKEIVYVYDSSGQIVGATTQTCTECGGSGTKKALA